MSNEEIRERDYNRLGHVIHHDCAEGGCPCSRISKQCRECGTHKQLCCFGYSGNQLGQGGHRKRKKVCLDCSIAAHEAYEASLAVA